MLWQQYNVFMRVDVSLSRNCPVPERSSLIHIGPGCAESNREDRSGRCHGQVAGDEEPNVK